VVKMFRNTDESKIVAGIDVSCRPGGRTLAVPARRST
jgi:hypothetical protein